MIIGKLLQEKTLEELKLSLIHCYASMQRKIFQINKKIFDFLIIIIKDYSEYTIHISIFLLYIRIYIRR